MNKPFTTLLTKHHCPECGAEIDGPGFCWLCKSPVTAPLKIQPAALEPLFPFAAPAKPDRTLLWLTLAASIMVIIVGIGTYLHEPWIGVAYFVFALPAMLAIAAVVLSFQFQAGSNASVGLRVLAGVSTFFLTLTVGIIVGMILIAAAITAMISDCFHAFGIQ